MDQRSVESAVREYRVPTASELSEAAPPQPAPATTPLVEEELLVEEVSIDGMCGVY